MQNSMAGGVEGVHDSPSWCTRGGVGDKGHHVPSTVANLICLLTPHIQIQREGTSLTVQKKKKIQFVLSPAMFSQTAQKTFYY